jgi:uncharacterized membrane protein
MTEIEKKAGLRPGQVIILIVGLVMFIYGVYGWVYPNTYTSVLWLQPLGLMLLGLFLLIAGGYFYPALQIANLSYLVLQHSLRVQVIQRQLPQRLPQQLTTRPQRQHQLFLTTK